MLAAIRRAESSLGELRKSTTTSAERELILLRGLVHEIRNFVLPAHFGRMTATDALRGISNLLNSPIDGVTDAADRMTSTSLAEMTVSQCCSTWNTLLEKKGKSIGGSVSVGTGSLVLVTNTLLANASEHGETPSVTLRFATRPMKALTLEVRAEGPRPAAFAKRGWGIGLWTAAMIVEGAGGELVFVPGRGRRRTDSSKEPVPGHFLVRLPINSEA